MRNFCNAWLDFNGIMTLYLFNIQNEKNTPK